MQIVMCEEQFGKNVSAHSDDEGQARLTDDDATTMWGDGGTSGIHS